MRQEVFSLTATKYGDGKFDIQSGQTMSKLDGFNLAVLLAAMLDAIRATALEQIKRLKAEKGQEEADEFADYFEKLVQDIAPKLYVRLDKEGLMVEEQAR